MRTYHPFLIFLLTPLVACAQVTQSVTEEVDGKTQYVQLAELTVTPQKTPVPALKYKLTWGFDQRVKNNAAIQYNYAMRALAQMKLNQLSDETRKFEENYARLFTEPEYFDEKKAEHDAFEKMLQAVPDDAMKNVETLRYEASLRYKPLAYSWDCTKPAAEFPIEEARNFVSRFHGVYRSLEAGSRCDYCDWEYPIRGNKNVIGVIIDEVQECRDLARALMVKIRLEIHDKNYDAAIRSLRVGKTLARHLGEGCPFIVGYLVGIAIDSMMNECLLELIQQPDAPNLYWTLAAFPPSPFSYADSMEVEMDVLRLMFPEVARAMDEPDAMTENDWKEFNRVLVKAAPSLIDSGWFSNDIKPETAVLIASGWGIAAYPKAKLWLASEGKTEQEIENMSVSKAIGLWSVYRYATFRDDCLKSLRLPYWQWERTNDLEQRVIQLEIVTPLDAIVRLLFPAFHAYHRAVSRSQASADVLRIVEAIRLYAAENGGKLPDKLDDITTVPIPPTDPFTGKPYVYRIENGRGVVEYDPGYGIQRTVIKLR